MKDSFVIHQNEQVVCMRLMTLVVLKWKLRLCKKRDIDSRLIYYTTLLGLPEELLGFSVTTFVHDVGE